MKRAGAPEWLSIPFVRSFPGSDDADRIQNLLGFQRDQLLRYVVWERELGPARPGGTSRSSIPLLLRRGGLTVQALRGADGLLSYVGVPVAGRPRTSPPLLFDSTNPPPEDVPVVVESVAWAPIEIHRRPGVEIEWALRVDRWTRGSAREWLPDTPSQREVSDVVPAVLDEFRRDARPAVRGALLGLAGSPRQVDGGPGLDLALGAPGIDSATAVESGATFAMLLPPWEVTNLRTRLPHPWGKPDRRFGQYSPYGVRLDRFGQSVAFRGHPVDRDESSILIGPGDGGTLLGMFFDGDHPVLRSADSLTELAYSNPTPEGLAPGASLFVYAHAVDVTTPTTSEMVHAEQRAADQIRRAVRDFLDQADLPARSIARLIQLSPGLRIGLRRAASAEARLSLRREVAPGDFKAVADSFAASSAAIAKGGDRREVVQYVNAATAELSARDRRRFAVLEACLRSAPDSLPEDIWDTVKSLELWDSLEELEEYIEVLNRRGAVLRPSGDRRLRWAG